MQNAPSVDYPVGRSLFWAGLLCLLGLAGVLCQVLWWRLLGPQQRSGLLHQVLLAGGLLLCGGWAAWARLAWLRAPVGRLRWDALAPAAGEGGRSAGAWRWFSVAFPDGAPLMDVSVVLDLQSRVLLRLADPGGRLRWVWAERDRDPPRWPGLRRALAAGVR